MARVPSAGKAAKTGGKRRPRPQLDLFGGEKPAAAPAPPPASPAVEPAEAPRRRPPAARRRSRWRRSSARSRSPSSSSKNRHLLGFDNPSKALLTTIKEAVDNSLDACEEAGILPELHVEVHDLALEAMKPRTPS